MLGVVPFSKAPQVTRSDYVYNANSSHWLCSLVAAAVPTLTLAQLRCYLAEDVAELLLRPNAGDACRQVLWEDCQLL